MKLDRFFTVPVLLSVTLHTALLIFIAGNWMQSKPEETIYKPHYVKATLVDMTPKAIAAPQQPKPQVLEAQRKQEQERKRQEEQERQQAEAKKIQQKKDQEAKAKAEEARLQKIKTEQAKQAAAKAEQQRKKEEEEKKRKAEAERKKREQQQREAMERLEAALQKEEQFLSERSDDANVQSYEALIQERIIQNWSRPPSARNGMQAILEINMVPTGQVVNVRVIKSSGDVAFDRSAEQAVKRVDRFTEIMGMPSDLFERNFRVFRLLFQPEDLRQ
ncbi:cell envelope integrity protein TolA [Cellvibrio sp. PSBB006]|uniref:cell envelope integrity protein TolA n=1 Tax=Cellvibrio sp. PSBB006 TaxID=1987723 RepID=UPI000B3B5316|nr:cell envelope integrity protein TolA [Cellvibrio sp. PSBB006]ARU29836.1 protein TolA [Cellvibrio sp. PSBB006]